MEAKEHGDEKIAHLATRSLAIGKKELAWRHATEIEQHLIHAQPATYFVAHACCIAEPV